MQSVWQSAAWIDNVRPNFLPESLMIQGALKRRIKWLLLAIILLTDQAAFAQEMSLRAVYNALSGVMAPIWVAQDAGLFVKHGVTVDLKYLAATRSDEHTSELQ